MDEGGRGGGGGVRRAEEGSLMRTAALPRRGHAPTDPLGAALAQPAPPPTTSCLHACLGFDPLTGLRSSST